MGIGLCKYAYNRLERKIQVHVGSFCVHASGVVAIDCKALAGLQWSGLGTPTFRPPSSSPFKVSLSPQCLLVAIQPHPLISHAALGPNFPRETRMCLLRTIRYEYQARVQSEVKV